MQATRAKRDVRFVDAMPSTSKIQGRKATVIRGVLMPNFFNSLVIPDYQRDAMEGAKHEELIVALDPETGDGVPDDIMLCVRTFDYHRVGDGELIVPTTGLVVLDGHQRVFASRKRLERGLETDPLGVKLFLGTTQSEELKTFYQINRYHTEVSGDIHLRNSGTNAAIEALARLQSVEGFPRINWLQRGISESDIRARTTFSVAIMLHFYNQENSIEDLLAKLESAVERVGTTLFADNVRTFFELLSGRFGSSELREVIYRAGFMRGLALFLASYQNFWDSKNPERLAIKAKDLEKLVSIRKKVIDGDLAMSSAANAVFNSFRRHFEVGRRSTLTPRELEDD